MGRIDAGTLEGKSLARPAHPPHRVPHDDPRPVVGYARAHGRTVAITERRASRGVEGRFLLPFQRLTDDRVRSARDFIDAMAPAPFAFNAATSTTATSRWCPRGGCRCARRRRPRAPDERRRRRRVARLPAGAPAPEHHQRRQRAAPELEQQTALGVLAADDNYAYGSLMRVQMLEDALAARPKHDLASVTAAMKPGGHAGLPRVADDADGHPRAAGGSRAEPPRRADGAAAGGLARERREPPRPRPRRPRRRPRRGHHGRHRDPGRRRRDGSRARAPGQPARDAHRARRRVRQRLLRRLGGLRREGPAALLGDRVRGPFRTKFCGHGDLAVCRLALWTAIDRAGSRLAAEQGPDPEGWHADANAERISFEPGLLPVTIRYTNRPSGAPAGHQLRRASTAEVVFVERRTRGPAHPTLEGEMSANLASILTDTAGRLGDRTAVKLDDAELTYAQLDEGSARAAAFLKSKGLEPGGRVGIMLPNVPYFPVAYYGVLRAGGVVVPMNVLLKGPRGRVLPRGPGGEARVRLHTSPTPRRPAPTRRAPRSSPSRPASSSRRWPPTTPTSASVSATPPTRGDPLHVRNHREAQGRRAHPRQPRAQRAVRARARGGHRGRRRARGAAALPLVRARRAG